MENERKMKMDYDYSLYFVIIWLIGMVSTKIIVDFIYWRKNRKLKLKEKENEN